MLYPCCLCLLGRHLRRHHLPALANLPAGAAEGSSATTRTLDPRRARAAAQRMMQLHPPSSLSEPMPPFPPFAASPPPAGPPVVVAMPPVVLPPLQSFPNSCRTTRGSTLQSSASWARDDAQLQSLLPPSGPTPTFVGASLLSLSHRGPPSCCCSRGR